MCRPLNNARRRHDAIELIRERPRRDVALTRGERPGKQGRARVVARRDLEKMPVKGFGDRNGLHALRLLGLEMQLARFKLDVLSAQQADVAQPHSGVGRAEHHSAPLAVAVLENRPQFILGEGATLLLARRVLPQARNARSIVDVDQAVAEGARERHLNRDKAQIGRSSWSAFGRDSRGT